MKALGLTGSIATGKSTTLEDFAALGVPVFSSDQAVHALYGNAETAERVDALFPGTARSGRVDRAELSRRLTAQPERLAALEALTGDLLITDAAGVFKIR